MIWASAARPTLSKGEIVAILPFSAAGTANTLNRGRVAGQVSSACAGAPHKGRRVRQNAVHSLLRSRVAHRQGTTRHSGAFRPGSGGKARRAVGNNRGGTSMKSRIAIAVSALTLGTALAVVPSFAQTNNQPGGTSAQQGSTGCIVFQQGCSDKPYPMNNSGQTGTSQSATARSASSGQNPSGEGQRAAQDRGAYRLGEPNRYYGYAPRAELGPAASADTQWCETRFRSFDPATGTYMGFDGIRHACP
jgi:hypothetical protein